MKGDLQKRIHKKMQAKDKLYGATTMGVRGQVVIPVEARKDLGLKPGDRLLVMGKFGKVLGLLKTDQLAEFVETIMKNLSGSGVEGEFKAHIESMFGRFLDKKHK